MKIKAPPKKNGSSRLNCTTSLASPLIRDGGGTTKILSAQEAMNASAMGHTRRRTSGSAQNRPDQQIRRELVVKTHSDPFQASG